MTKDRRMIERRTGFQIPSVPGNYPQNFINDLGTLLKNHPADIEEIHKPLSVRRIILAVDIRNFSRTLGEEDEEKVLQFLSEFFGYSSDIIQGYPCAYINKFFGDGFFAQMNTDCEDVNDKVEIVLDIALDLLRCFTALKMHYKFLHTNLSIAITETDCIESTIGSASSYLDFSLIGMKLNGLFRLLSRTKGSIIALSDEIIPKTRKKYHSVYIGTKNFSGMVAPVPIYSLIRKKFEDEILNQATFNVCNTDDCPTSYQNCERAWEAGRASTSTDGKEFFNLDCNNCGENSPCPNWSICQRKYLNIEDNKICICCHICPSYRNCYNAFQLGRRGQDLINCDKTIYYAHQVIEGETNTEERL